MSQANNRGHDRILDLRPDERDRIATPTRFEITTLQQGDDLLLEDHNHNLHTNILNTSLDTLIQYQPNLFWSYLNYQAKPDRSTKQWAGPTDI